MPTSPTHPLALAAGIVGLACGCTPSRAQVEPVPVTPPGVVGSVTPATPPALRDRPVAAPRLARAEAFVGKHVLIAAGAELGVAATPESSRLRLQPPTERLPHAFAFAVVDYIGGMLVLEPAAADARCDPGLDELGLAGVRFYVPPTSAAPVLARESETVFADGTSVRLRAGTAVLVEGPDGVAEVGGARLHVPINPESVGNAFEPSGVRQPDDSAPAPTDVALRYGEHTLAAPRVFRRATPVAGGAAPADAELVDLVSACADVRARIEVAAPEALRLAGPASFGMRSQTWEVPAGTPATWVDGSPAGTLVASRGFDRRGERRDERTCFVASDAASRFETYELCFATGAVTHLDHLARPPAGRSARTIGSTLPSGEISDVFTFTDLQGRPPPRAGAGAASASIAATIDGVSTKGARSKATVQAQIGPRVEQIAGCAERTTPATTGVVTAEFTIVDDGTVRGVSVGQGEAIAACVRSKILRWRFGTGETTTVSVTFALASRK